MLINRHKPAYEGQASGNYVLNWNKMTVKYRTGKTLVQYIHAVLHVDTNDKIDFVVQYLRRVPIITAMTK